MSLSMVFEQTVIHTDAETRQTGGWRPVFPALETLEKILFLCSVCVYTCTLYAHIEHVCMDYNSKCACICTSIQKMHMYASAHARGGGGGRDARALRSSGGKARTLPAVRQLHGPARQS